MAWPQDKKPYNQFAPGTPTAKAQQANVDAIKGGLRTAANVADKYAGGAGGRALGRSMMAPVTGLQQANARQNDALKGYPEKNKRLQAFGGQLQQDIAGGNFPRPKAFQPITRPPMGAAARETVGQPDNVTNTNKVSLQQADGGKGSITVTPGTEHLPLRNNLIKNPVSNQGNRIGNLDVEFDGMPADERDRFTKSAIYEANNPSRQALGQPSGQRQTIARPEIARPEIMDVDMSSMGSMITSRWGQKADLQKQQAFNDADKNNIAMRGQDIDVRGQDLTADGNLRRDLLTGRGQDLNYDNDGPVREGHTLDNQGKQLGLDQTQALNNLFAQYNDPNVPAENKQAIADEIRLRQGKTDKKQRPITMTRATADGMGSETILVDPETYEEIQVQKGSQALTPPPKETKGLPVGHKAVSASGVPIIWDGKGWKPA